MSVCDILDASRQLAGEGHKPDAPKQLWEGRILAYNGCRRAGSRDEGGEERLNEPLGAQWQIYFSSLSLC